MIKIFRVSLAAGLLAIVSGALAGEVRPYSDEQFESLTARNAPVVVAVHADWCPTCKAQRPVIDTLMSEPAYRDVTTLVVDFDADKSAVKRHRAVMQSTLVGYHGKREVGRLVGETSAKVIETLVGKTLE